MPSLSVLILVHPSIISLMISGLPRSTLFPYTTLFRSLASFPLKLPFPPSYRVGLPSSTEAIPKVISAVRPVMLRSEERRVGKECRCRRVADAEHHNGQRGDIGRTGGRSDRDGNDQRTQ